jgi:hypothetical protein
MLEFGTYTHEIILHFIEVRRSDHVAMITHHVSTLALISGSYVCNFLPVGSLVMVTHDFADSFLELAKLFNYMCKARPWTQQVGADHHACPPSTPPTSISCLPQSQCRVGLWLRRLCVCVCVVCCQVTDNLFVAFAVAFFLSRLVVFPFWVVRHTLTLPQQYIGKYRGVDALNGFLCVLVCLHIYWMSMIVRMALKMASDGKAEKDGRSDDDSDLEASDKED